MDSENTLQNLEMKVQERLDNLNDKLDDFSQKYNKISLETKNNSSRRSKKIRLNSITFISICVCVLTFIVYIILIKTEPEFVKEKNTKTFEYEVSSLKLWTCSFGIAIFFTIILYFGYYIYKNFKT